MILGYAKENQLQVFWAYRVWAAGRVFSCFGHHCDYRLPSLIGVQFRPIAFKLG